MSHRCPTTLPALSFAGLKISLGARCNARCAHCSVSAGPHERQRLGREQVGAAIDDAAALGLGSLGWTGGEVFLFYRELLAHLERASGHGLPSLVDSNGFWAKDRPSARRYLAPLKERGLLRLVLSTDRYHQAFVPLERIIHALEAARELGIATAVTLSVLPGDPGVLETVSRLRGLGGEIQVQHVTPFGRAADLPRERMALQAFPSAGQVCNAVALPTIHPDGRVTLCCAPPGQWPREVAETSPLILGWLDRESLATILGRARQDPFLRLFAAEGLAGVLTRVRERWPELWSPRPEGYFGTCDLCREVLGTQPTLARIRTALGELSPEVSAAIAMEVAA